LESLFLESVQHHGVAKRTCSMSGEPSVGSGIALITVADVRYEGILVAIDGGAVALQNVRSFGTEQSPTSDFIDRIVFRSSDIKEMYSFDPPAQVLTGDAMLDDSEYRPWTAEFPTTNGVKTKYNLATTVAIDPPGSSVATATTSFVKTVDTKAARERWAAGCPKGVDFERDSGNVPRTAHGRGGEPVSMIQGYFPGRHPQFGETQL